MSTLFRMNRGGSTEPLAVIVAALGLLGGTPAAFAQADVSNAGTLTCTAAPSTDAERSEVELSCNFKAQDGSSSDYKGVALRDAAALTGSKQVFVWSVVTLDKETAPLLEGTFRGESTAGQGMPVLKGGRDDTVRLEPMTGTAQDSRQPTPTVISLELVATKT